MVNPCTLIQPTNSPLYPPSSVFMTRFLQCFRIIFSSFFDLFSFFLLFFAFFLIQNSLAPLLHFSRQFFIALLSIFVRKHFWEFDVIFFHDSIQTFYDFMQFFFSNFSTISFNLFHNDYFAIFFPCDSKAKADNIVHINFHCLMQRSLDSRFYRSEF